MGVTLAFVAEALGSRLARQAEVGVPSLGRLARHVRLVE